MKYQVLLISCAVSILCVSWNGATLFASNVRPRPLAFDELRMHLEVDLPAARGAQPTTPARSFLDLPAEVVLQASASSGLARVRVLDSSGRSVIELECPSPTSRGLAELELEFEGATLAQALREIPPGTYFVDATTVDGLSVEGVATLRGGFPGAFTVLSPLSGAVVDADSVTIAWTASAGAARYVLEVEAEELGFNFSIQLPPWRTSYTLPALTLEPGRTYEYSLGVQGDTDNELELEGHFVTAGGVSVPPQHKGH